MKPPASHVGESRHREEERVRNHAQQSPSPSSPDLTQKLVHELQARQIELELQNDQLREKRAQAEAGLERYADFYDSSAAGLFTLERDGVIAQVNLTGARLLGLERSRLIGRRFALFVTERNRREFDACLQHLFEDGTRQRCELELVISDPLPTTVQISATLSPDGKECRGVMEDVSERKRVEAELREMAQNLEAKVIERTSQLRRVSAQLTMTEEHERRQLAENLHDHLGQLLAIIKIKLTSITNGSTQAAIDQVVGLVDQADEAARTVTQQLSPPLLYTLGLIPALNRLGEEIERTYGIAVHVDHDPRNLHLNDEVSSVLYRAARELLINVAKHAKTGAANLFCLYDDRRVTLMVSDAGCGFDPSDHFGAWPGHQSFGLRSILERITNIGGQMEIDSSPGEGTTVTLSVPHSLKDEEIR